jgi:uridine monophosphate synthetase
MLDDRTRLIMEMNAHGFVRWSEKPFPLKSGIESHVYVFGREDLTDEAYFGFLFGKVVAQEVNELADPARKPIIIGIPTAATSLAAASSYASWFCEFPRVLGYRVMREKQKNHGANGSSWVNGSPRSDQEYFTIENVVTSGNSLKENLERMAADGYMVKEMHHLVAVDREQGGVELLRREGYHVHVLFTLREITQTYVVWKKWNTAAQQLVEQEVEAHRFT